jgi:hypothetical protein
MGYTFGDCYYCGSSVKDATTSHNITRAYETIGVKHNGLDRIDSNLGYESCNIVSCCKSCNTMKSDLDIDYFKNKIMQIYRHLKLE